MRRVLASCLISMVLLGSPSLAKEADPGDADGDGSVTVRDALAVLRRVAGVAASGSVDEVAADVHPSPGAGPRAGWRYGDGRLDTADALRILQAAAGLSPLGANWPPPALSVSGPAADGEPLPVGAPAWVQMAWGGAGEPSWSVAPEGAANLWLLDDGRSAILTAGEPVTATLSASMGPYGASRDVRFQAAGEAPVEVSLTTDRYDYPPLWPVHITVTASNRGSAPFASDSGVLVLAFDTETRRQVWEARDPQWTQKVELAPGQSRTWSFEWRWEDMHGGFVQPRPFKLFARLGTSPPILNPPAEVVRIAVY